MVDLTAVVVPWYISIGSENTAFFSLTEADGRGFVPANFNELIVPEAVIGSFVKKYLSSLFELFDNMTTLNFI